MKDIVLNFPVGFFFKTAIDFLISVKRKIFSIISFFIIFSRRKFCRKFSIKKYFFIFYPKIKF